MAETKMMCSASVQRLLEEKFNPCMSILPRQFAGTWLPFVSKVEMIWTSVLLAVELRLDERTCCSVVKRAITIVVNPTSLEEFATAHFLWCDYGINRSIEARTKDKSKSKNK